MTFRLITGDCLEAMARMDEASVDAIVTDPPYGLEFMGRKWDSFRGSDIDPGFLHWFAGFTDGEGCFSVHKKNVNGYETYDCQFSISLRADDRPILERIHRTLGIGTLSKPTAHQNGRENPAARYSVSAKAELVELRSILRAFPLRAKKAADFEMWSDALDAWIKHEPGEWDEMAELRSTLMASRAYKPEGVRVDPYQMWTWRWGREALRVLRPGGHALVFGGTRTFHRMAAGLEDAGFEIRDTLAWLMGSGFPKSLNLDGEWAGWGTALKPAWEGVTLARKPLVGTVAGNVLAHGTGALNVDGCRIGTEDSTGRTKRRDSPRDQFSSRYQREAGYRPNWTRDSDEILTTADHPAGRWPANVLLDEQAAAMLDEQTGELNSTRPGNPNEPHNGNGGGLFGVGRAVTHDYRDQGGASRFYYTSKASSAERNRGVEWMEPVTTRGNYGDGIQDARPHTPEGYVYEAKTRNTHPTVKPVDLMQWLVRLITPPGGTVLDPFTGSGSTGIAALREGFEFIGIEREESYVDIARARIIGDGPLFNVEET